MKKYIIILLKNIFILAFIIYAAAAFAGDDVELYNAEGNKLSPSQIGDVDIEYTCGSCHEVDEKSKNVHFNRSDKSADAQSGYCLDCHLGDPAKAFNEKGNIIHTPKFSGDNSCLSCHTEQQEWKDSKANIAHNKMNCYQCHQDSGHNTDKPANCKTCHTNGWQDAKIPTHFGLPNRHFSDLSCTACHSKFQYDGKTNVGYLMDSNKIYPINSEGMKLYHSVLKAGDGWGGKGCTDCHSIDSKFFLGKTISTDDNNKIITKSNHQIMGVTKLDINLGGLREQLLKPISSWIFILVLAMSIVHYVFFGPRRVDIPKDDEKIRRFGFFEIFLHATCVLSFTFLAVTGVMFLLRFESQDWNLRFIHGRVGIIFILSTIGMIIAWWKNSLFVSCDKIWVQKMGGYLWDRCECPAEKFNAGQKIFFWGILVLCGFVINFSGVLLILGNGTSSSWVYTIHDAAAVAMISAVIGHIYLTLFANPGTIHSMISGKVFRSWAKHHHPDWLERLENPDKSCKLN
ncbi:MAG: cytochrome b/b6 domain-containing protein [Armatimonadota bacterium]